MRRFFTEPHNIDNNTATITEDSLHITKVLRMQEGDIVTLFDGTGYEYIARLTSVDKDLCSAEIISKSLSSLEPDTKVIIYQGIPKSGKMEGIIQKSVELGVHSIVPVEMDRCVAKLDGGKKQAEKIKRWNKVAVEAAKQCGRGILPEVKEPLSFKAAIEQMKSNGLALMPYEILASSDNSSVKNVLSQSNETEISVIIGPEGGFSDFEAEYAKEQGINLVGLGKRILRTETVSSAVLAIIMYEKNEM